MACLLLALFILDACEFLLAPQACKMCYGIAVLSAPLLLKSYYSHMGLKCGNGTNNDCGEFRYLATFACLFISH